MVGFNVIKWVGIGLVGAFTIIFLRDAAQKGLGPAAGDVGAGFGSIGSAIGSTLTGVGQGIQAFGTGVGTGAAQLFNPLFTLRDLIYGPQAGNQPAPTSATQGQLPAETPPIGSSPSVTQQMTPPPPISIQSNIPVIYNRPGFVETFFGIATKPIQLPGRTIQVGQEYATRTYTRIGGNTVALQNIKGQTVKVSARTAVALRQRGYAL